MHKILLLFACLLTANILIAQNADEKAVAARMETLHNALLKPGEATLADIAADGLTYGHSTGLIEDKAAFIEDLVSGKTVFTSVEFTDQSIKIQGSVAIVRHHMMGETNNNNKPAKIDIIVLLIWQKQKGQWKLLARQAAKVPPPAQ